MERFNASIRFDRRLLSADIEGNTAYAHGLQRIGVLSEEECARIVEGLQQVEREFSDPDYPLPDALEDIHMAVERRLTEIVGSSGGKIHTGRSRNDQVNPTSGSTFARKLRPCASALWLCRRSCSILRSGICRWSPRIYASSAGSAHSVCSLCALAFWMLESATAVVCFDAWKRADYMPFGFGRIGR